MEPRKRYGLGALWLAVTALALVTVGDLALTVGTVASLLAAAFALWLAVVYLVNPWGLLDRLPQ